MKTINRNKIVLLSILLLYFWRNYFSLQNLPDELVTDDIFPLKLAVFLKNYIIYIYILWLVFSLAAIVKRTSVYIISLTTVLFMLLCGVYNSIGHVFHTDIVPIFALIAINLATILKNKSEEKYFLILISNVYFISGISKLMNSYSDWLNGDALLFSILYNKITRSDNFGLIHGYAQDAVGSAIELFAIFSTIVLLLELSAPAIAYYNKRFFSVLFFLFHVLNYFLFGLKFFEYYIILIFLNFDLIQTKTIALFRFKNIPYKDGCD